MNKTNSAYMTEDERRQAIDLLEETRQEFLLLTQDLSQAQWTTLPEPDAWSVALVSEHIINSEIGINRIIQRLLASPPNPDWEEATAGKIELLNRVMPMRQRKAEAPELVRPRGKIALAELRSRYRRVRQKTLEFAGSLDQPLKQYASAHPFFGLLNGYQWLVCIPLHNLRHNLQIVEVLERVSRKDAKTQRSTKG